MVSKVLKGKKKIKKEKVLTFVRSEIQVQFLYVMFREVVLKFIYLGENESCFQTDFISKRKKRQRASLL